MPGTSLLTQGVSFRTRPEPPLHLGRLDPVELDDLVARRVAGDDADVGVCQAEPVREEPDDLVVRPPSFGCRANPQLPSVAEPAQHLGSARAGGDADAQAK
jgi:hypothetical protein